MLVVVLLAALAALLYAVSDFLEQRAAQRARRGLTPRRGTDRMGLLRSVGQGASRLVHDRLWLAGWAVGTLGYLAQGVGLHLGSVAVVQALQATTLLFSLPLATVGRPERPRLIDLLAAAAVCLGLGLFLYAWGAQTGVPHRGRIIVLLLVIVAVIVVLTWMALRIEGVLRATFLAAGAGCAFACSALLVKLTSRDLTERGVIATALDWPGYLLALTSVAGVVLQQVAFASGRLPTATTASIVANPIVGTLIAIIGFDEHLPTEAWRRAFMVGAALSFAVGMAVLPRSPLLRDTSAGPPECREEPGRRKEEE
jgi:hypothetical protein